VAQRVSVELEDDIQGGPADETITFGFDRKSYTIDLSRKNADKFRKVIAPYVNAARRDTAVRPSRTTASEVDAKAVRAWAASNGYQVSARGRVSAEIVAAFRGAGT
jgi:hypothetical protein